MVRAEVAGARGWWRRDVGGGWFEERPQRRGWMEGGGADPRRGEEARPVSKGRRTLTASKAAQPTGGTSYGALATSW